MIFTYLAKTFVGANVNAGFNWKTMDCIAILCVQGQPCFSKIRMGTLNAHALAPGSITQITTTFASAALPTQFDV